MLLHFLRFVSRIVSKHFNDDIRIIAEIKWAFQLILIFTTTTSMILNMVVLWMVYNNVYLFRCSDLLHLAVLHPRKCSVYSVSGNTHAHKHYAVCGFMLFRFCSLYLETIPFFLTRMYMCVCRHCRERGAWRPVPAEDGLWTQSEENRLQHDLRLLWRGHRYGFVGWNWITHWFLHLMVTSLRQLRHKVTFMQIIYNKQQWRVEGAWLSYHFIRCKTWPDDMTTYCPDL